MKSCEFCSKKFRGAAKLKQHMWRAHLGYKASGLLVCLICHLLFPQRTSLKNHVRREHMNLPHGTCSACGANIVSKGAWRRHKKHHNDGAKIITQKKILTHEIAGNLEMEKQKLIDKMMAGEEIQQDCDGTMETSLEKYCNLKVQAEDLRAKQETNHKNSILSEHKRLSSDKNLTFSKIASNRMSGGIDFPSWAEESSKTPTPGIKIDAFLSRLLKRHESKHLPLLGSRRIRVLSHNFFKSLVLRAKEKGGTKRNVMYTKAFLKNSFREGNANASNLNAWDLILAPARRYHHWTLLCIYPQRKEIVQYTSTMTTTWRKAMTVLKHFFTYLDKKENGYSAQTWGIEPPVSFGPQETNFDSDTFICAAAESLIFNSDPTKIKMGSTQKYKHKMLNILAEPSS